MLGIKKNVLKLAKCEVLFISESNMDTNNEKKMAKRERDFPDFRFFDKTLPWAGEARMTVMISNDIKAERLDNMEDNQNPMKICRVKDSKSKWNNFVAFYRQWNDPRDGNLNKTESTERQVVRFKFLIEVMSNVNKYQQIGWSQICKEYL